MTSLEYDESAIMDMTIRDPRLGEDPFIVKNVVVAIYAQSGSTLWRWWIPAEGIEEEGRTQVDFPPPHSTEWQHKCDVSAAIKASIVTALISRKIKPFSQRLTG